MRRYTNALALLNMIRKSELTLLSPVRWFDQNDALGLEAYGKLCGDGSVYAMCLALGIEQAHHWQLFAPGDHGVCIVFDEDGLIEHLDSIPSILHGPVQYHNLSQIKAMRPIAREALPFLKRDTFKAEAEYRIVAWEDSFFAMPTHPIPLPPKLVQRVVFGPAVPEAFSKTLMDIEKESPRWKHVHFAKSRLVNNESWAQAIEEGIGQNISNRDKGR